MNQTNGIWNFATLFYKRHVSFHGATSLNKKAKEAKKRQTLLGWSSSKRVSKSGESRSDDIIYVMIYQVTNRSNVSLKGFRQSGELYAGVYGYIFSRVNMQIMILMFTFSSLEFLRSFAFKTPFPFDLDDALVSDSWERESEDGWWLLFWGQHPREALPLLNICSKQSQQVNVQNVHNVHNVHNVRQMIW